VLLVSSCRTTIGFSLIELLVVLAILGFLAGFVGPRLVGPMCGGSKTKIAKLQIEDFATGLDLYHLEVKRYPNTAEGLAALITKPANTSSWNGPYLKNKKIPKDPWGRKYHYRLGQDGRFFRIYSLGSDNSYGGEGEAQDIMSWEF